MKKISFFALSAFFILALLFTVCDSNSGSGVGTVGGGTGGGNTTFYPVENITGVPATATAGTQRTLTGTVSPTYATNRTIVWSIQNAGTTGATINGST